MHSINQLNNLSAKLLITFLVATLLFIITNTVYADEFDLTVNGRKIPREQMELIFKENQSQIPEGANLKQIVRDSVIRREVLAQQAIKEKINNKSKVKLQLEMVKRNTLAAAYMDHSLQQGVSENDLKNEYNRVIKEYTGRKEYLTKHILVNDQATADRISKELKSKPKSFEEIAKKESVDTGSAANGGELGWVSLGTMVHGFEKGLIATKPGRISDPVKSQFGYHIIKVEKVRDLQPPKYENVKERIREQLTREKAEKIITELIGKAKIQ